MSLETSNAWTPERLERFLWIMESNDPKAIEAREEMLAILTPEQRKKMEAILEE